MMAYLLTKFLIHPKKLRKLMIMNTACEAMCSDEWSAWNPTNGICMANRVPRI